MREILFEYRMDPTTWAYVSALMMVGIYFKFRRFWSVRNLDLIALISFTPGFLLIYHGLLKDKPELIPAGYVWIFAVSAFFLVRLLLDPVMVRRPLLEPNLSASGLTFTGVSLLIFLMANVITTPKDRLEYQLAVEEAAQKENQKSENPPTPSPGYVWFYTFAGYANDAMAPSDQPQPENNRENLIRIATTRTVTILAHLAVVIGMVWIGYRHFDNVHTGVAAATLYLLTFYTSQLTGRVDYVAPAALLVWAVAAYRLPIVSGLLIGLATGLIYYPLFLLPLWCAFYWRRGLVRFAFGVLLSLTVLAVLLALYLPDTETFFKYLRQMVGWRDPFAATLSGFWQYYEAWASYRIPVLAAFVAICLSLAIWPAQKNLGTLLSCSAAVMLATQFWHAHQGGLCMAWYLPLLILTIFRPNLEDRVAMSAVRPGWARRKKV